MRELQDAYQLLRRLGHGAMAEVHLAERISDGEQVAIKRMLPHRAEEAETRVRFDEEIAVLERLKHPNIVELLEVVEDAGQPAMVLGHLPGPSLSALYAAASKAAGGVPAAVSVRVIGELLSALGYAHGLRGPQGSLGLVHRDVTPSNLLFGEGARPVLIDFGVARTNDRTPITRTGAVVGKVGYLAPEIARGEDVDERADLFSVAAILFELICGAPPFPGDTLGDVLNRVASGGHQDPRALKPALSDAQAALLVKGIACAPESRFASAWEMSAELHTAFESASGEALIELVEGLFPGTTSATPKKPTTERRGPKDTLTIATQSMVGTEPSGPPVDD